MEGGFGQCSRQLTERHASVSSSCNSRMGCGVPCSQRLSVQLRPAKLLRLLPTLACVLVCFQILSSGDSASIDRAAAMARGVYLTRFLVEAPPNVANPTHLAEAAAMIAAEFPEVSGRLRRTRLLWLVTAGLICCCLL